MMKKMKVRVLRSYDGQRFGTIKFISFLKEIKWDYFLMAQVNSFSFVSKFRVHIKNGRHSKPNNAAEEEVMAP